MKNTLIPVLIACVSLAVLGLSGCATTAGRTDGSAQLANFYVPAVDEELYGTWVNPELSPPSFPQKIVFYPWGLVEQFNMVAATVYDWRGTATIARRWKDADGNTWYWQYQRTAIKDSFGAAMYALVRVSADEQTMEGIMSGAGWPNPADMDPDQNTSYAKYTRST